MKKLSWLEKLANSVALEGSESSASSILRGAEGLSSASSPRKKAEWVTVMLERLGEQFDADEQIRVMKRCSCTYRGDRIRFYKNMYDRFHNIDLIIESLQRETQEHIRQSLGSEPDLLKIVTTSPFYHGPVREGERISEVKFPYHLVGYLKETDPQARRRHTCHCGWVNASQNNLPLVYCACGAGFYQQLWEGILSRPVEVRTISSVMHGDEYCRTVVQLPADCGRSS